MSGWLLFGAFFLTQVLIYGVLALGLNTQYGLAGMANFGYVALFAAGAFGYSLATLPPPGGPGYLGLYEIGLGLPFALGFVVAGVVGALFALLVAMICLRLGGHYFAMVTFALAQIFGAFLSNEEWLTRGQFGISPVPQPLRGVASSAESYLYLYLGLSLIVAIGCLWAAQRVSGSPFGRVLRGIREDEVAAGSLGKHASVFKLKGFVFGGALAGVAGALWVGSIGAVHVGQFVPIVTFTVWLAVLLGGIGNNMGVLLGAFLLILIREGTRFLEGIPMLAEASAANPSFLPSLRYVVIGLALVLVVRFAPRGVIPERLRTRRKHGTPHSATPGEQELTAVGAKGEP